MRIVYSHQSRCGSSLLLLAYVPIDPEDVFFVCGINERKHISILKKEVCCSAYQVNISNDVSYLSKSIYKIM